MSGSGYPNSCFVHRSTVCVVLGHELRPICRKVSFALYKKSETSVGSPDTDFVVGVLENGFEQLVEGVREVWAALELKNEVVFSCGGSNQ